MVRRTRRRQTRRSSTRKKVTARKGSRFFRRSRQSQPSIGRLIATGVKNIIPLLPGSSVLAPIADVAFKMFGLSTALTASGNPLTITATTSFYGMMTVFCVSLVNFMSTLKGTVTGYGGERKLLSIYPTGRLISFEITIKPDGVQQNRSGQLVVGIQPFMTSDQAATWNNPTGKGWPTERGVKQMYLSKVGPATQPITIRFVPTPEHGFCYQTQLITQTLLAVVVRYEDFNRTAYSTFTAADASFSIVSKARFEVRNPYPGAESGSTGDAVQYDDVVNDSLKAFSAQIYDATEERIYVMDAPGYSCTKNSDGACTVKGTGKVIKLRGSADSDALDAETKSLGFSDLSME